MYMQNIRLFAKIEKELETLIREVWIYSQKMGMGFGIEKYAMLIMKSIKWHQTDGMELLNREKFTTLGEKEANKYFGILEADIIKQVDMREQKRRIYQENQKATREKKNMASTPG